jgi:hypothetical protein
METPFYVIESQNNRLSDFTVTQLTQPGGREE